MRRRLLFFTIAVLMIYVLHATAWAQVVSGGSISGTLMTLDGAERHTAVPVQAILDGKVAATTLSDADGKYKFASLKPGAYRVRCQVLGGYVYYGEEKASDAGKGVILKIEAGKAYKNIDFRFAPFKKGTWKTYTAMDGLAHTRIFAICMATDGTLWFGTEGGGVSRYDGREFVNLTTRDGLAQIDVYDICQDSSGIVWFGTTTGVSQYDGREFLHSSIIEENSLMNGWVPRIYCDPDGVIWFSVVGKGVLRYDGKELVNFTTEDGLAANTVTEICQDQNGAIWFATVNGISRYNGDRFETFTTADGLANNFAHTAYCDPDSVMWFGTQGGVSRYDGEEFINLTIEDGLVNNDVQAIQRDPDGVMWFGTWGGVSRYDGETFVNFTEKDGLLAYRVRAIQSDPDGVIWFGSYGGLSRYDTKAIANFTSADGYVNFDKGTQIGAGVLQGVHRDSDGTVWFAMNWGDFYRYDGKGFVRVTLEGDPSTYRALWGIFRNPDGDMWFTNWDGIQKFDGKTLTNFNTENSALLSNEIWSMYRDSSGMMWFGTVKGGASRYDGKTFTNLTTKDGLLDDRAYCFYQEPNGMMWIGTGNGISCYDGERFVKSFTTEDGLTDNDLDFIHCDPDGMLWIGAQYGMCRYDGEKFIRFGKDEELAWCDVRSMYCSPDGIMWFGTYGRGVLLYDGEVWTSLDRQDGLVSDNIWPIHQDSSGDMWFEGHIEGITRYRRSTHPPRVCIVSLTADRRYEDLSSIPTFTSGARVTIEYNSMDFRTRPEKRQYRCRIKEVDPGWSRATKATSSDFIFDEPGTYTFQVQAIDRDLNYSEPASLELIVLTPFYMRAAFLAPVLAVGALLLLTSIISATAYFRHRRQVQAYQRAAVEELQDAKDMQLSLLPETPPQVEGIEIAGRSITANTVGGDFLDYLSLPYGKVGIAVADVSGKGLRAAMNATMTNGMMHEVATIEASCGSILSRLNAHLYPLMERQMFTAFSFAIIDPDSGVMQWANAAQPLPLIKRGTAASEISEDGALPLGMAPDVKYTDYQLEFQAGDTVIFYTDGIIEAENEAEEMYGTERLLDFVAGIDASSSAENVIDAILRDVNDFVGSAEQYDDMTVVVVKKLENNDAP